MRKLRDLFVFFLLLGACFAQGPGTPGQPNKRSDVSAFTPYQFPSAPQQAGLWVMVSSGQVLVGTNVVMIPTARVAVGPSTKTYIFVDMTAGTISSNTTGFTAGNYPVATASTNATFVYDLEDTRPDIFGGGGGGIGTITGVTAGTGLTGGGTTGTVPISLVTSCSVSQVLQWNGSSWICASVGTGNVSTAPGVGVNQPIVQPVNTTFSADSLAFWRIVTPSWNWAQTPAADLSSAGAGKTITLTPCPKGIDTASAANNYIYRVYISGTGTPEAALVTGGTCTGGASSGTIIVTTVNAHSAGYTVGSASTGIQEAWNDAWVNDSGAAPNANSQAAPYVKLSAGTNYSIFSSVYLRGRGGVLDGAGALLVCSTRDRCVFVGTSAGIQGAQKIYNLNGTSTVNQDGVQVSSASASSGTYTITTAASHGFSVGDTIDCEYYSQNVTQHWMAQAVFPTVGTTITVQFGSNTFVAGANNFGFCNIENAFIEDNSDGVKMSAVNIFTSLPAGSCGAGCVGTFSYGIIDDNDQQLEIDHLSNRGTPVLRSALTVVTANFPTGSMVYERGDQGNAGIVYLRNSELTNVNCVTATGNGLVVTDSVCQAFPLYGIRYFGGLQPLTVNSVYEDHNNDNPLYHAVYSQAVPTAMGYLVQGGKQARIVGAFPGSGTPPTFPCTAGGGGARNYFVVPHSSTLGVGSPLFVGSATGCNSGNITVAWPSIQLQDHNNATIGTLTWDILMTTGTNNAPFGTGTFYLTTPGTPVSGACNTGGMCTFTDTQSAAVSGTVAAQTFIPQFWFWPTAYVVNWGISLHFDVLDTTPFAVSSAGTSTSSIVADQCGVFGNNAQRTPIWITCLSNSSLSGQGTEAEIMQQADNANAGPAANSKGRINLGKAINNTPNDLITLQDSNFLKTISTSGERPSNDAGDIAIGLDATNGLNLRAPASLSFNLNTVPTGSNWLFKANSTLFSTTVPINSSVGFQVAGLAPTNHCLIGNGTNYVDSSSCGGTSVNINGGAVASANFNDTTPAAATNGLNVKWQVSGANISAYLLGDTNAAHCLSGIGTYVPCSGGVSGLGVGQRATPNSATTLANSGPTFYTEKLTGATWDARLNYCLTNAAALNSLPGVCDMTAETGTSSTTVANGVMAQAGQIVILPPVTLTLGTGFFFNVTGAQSGLTCIHKWACVVDGSNNGSAGLLTLNGVGSYAERIKWNGGRLNKQTGNEVIVNATERAWFWENWITNAGQDAILITNNSTTSETQASIRYNVIDQSGSAAILINNSNNSSSTTHNDIGNNLTRDANVNFNQNTQGTIGAGCSSANCAAVPATQHGADYNSFHDNIILYQALGSGDCNNPNFGTLAITSWSGSGTASITFTYTTTQPAGGLPVVGQVITGASFAVGGLNANATVTASTTTTITATYAGTVTGSTGTGTITYTPGTGDTACSEGIQTTDTAWYSEIKNNSVYLSSKEGIVFSGIGSQVVGNYCDGCGLHAIGATASGAIAWEKSTRVQASPGYVGDTVITDNVITNSTSTLLRYGIQHGFTCSSTGTCVSATYTDQNTIIANNVIDGTNGSGGFTNGILINAASGFTGTVTLVNFRVENNNVFGSVTTPFNPNSYTNITGVARLSGNGFNTTTDTAPVSGDIVCFDANLQPELDCGTLGTNVLTGVVAGQGLAVTGHNLELIQSCTNGQTLQWNSGTSQWACSPGIVTGTTNAVGLYTSSTTFGPSNVPTANGNYVLSASVTTSASGVPALNLPGVPIDTESSATPAVTGSSSGSTSPNTTRASVFQTTNNTTSTASSIAQAGSAGFTSNYTFAAMNSGSVINTLTPTTSTINGNATIKFPGKVAGHNPSGALVYSDNTNYFALQFLPTDANGFLAAEGFNVATSCTTCVTASSPGAGIAHFAGSTQAVTSSAVSLTADVSGVLPFANMSQLFVTNAQTATYQVLAADFTGCKTIPVASGTFTITLVASGSQPASGQCIDIINYGSGVVTVARSGQNINGGTTSLTIQAGTQAAPNGAHVVSDGTNYEMQLWGLGAVTGTGSTVLATSPTLITPNIGVAIGTSLSLGTDNSVAGTLTLANGSANAHTIFSSGATTTNTIQGFAAVPTTGHLIDCIVTITTCLLHDSAVTTANVVTEASNATAAGQIHTSGGADKTAVSIDFPERFFIPSANCNNTTAGAGWSIGSGGTVTCRAGTNNLGGYVTITDTSSTFAQFTLMLPFDWDTATRPYIRFYFSSASDTTNGHTVIPQIKVSCPTATNGTTSDDATFTAAQSSSTVTFGASAVANGFYGASNVQIGSTQMTGCVAGGMMIVQVGRATDTATGNINFYGADVTFPRLITVQAN